MKEITIFEKLKTWVLFTRNYIKYYKRYKKQFAVLFYVRYF